MSCDASAAFETGTAAPQKRLSRMNATTPTIARIWRGRTTRPNLFSMSG
jgi:hypothetical protein